MAVNCLFWQYKEKSKVANDFKMKFQQGQEGTIIPIHYIYSNMYNIIRNVSFCWVCLNIDQLHLNHPLYLFYANQCWSIDSQNFQKRPTESGTRTMVSHPLTPSVGACCGASFRRSINLGLQDLRRQPNQSLVCWTDTGVYCFIGGGSCSALFASCRHMIHMNVMFSNRTLLCMIFELFIFFFLFVTF